MFDMLQIMGAAARRVIEPAGRYAPAQAMDAPARSYLLLYQPRPFQPGCTGLESPLPGSFSR